jgi:hypothetical protein
MDGHLRLPQQIMLDFVTETRLLMKLNRSCCDKGKWSFIRSNLDYACHAHEFNQEQFCMLLLVRSVHFQLAGIGRSV